VPAVIGMRRRVDVVVMNRVTAALYGDICHRVSTLLAAGPTQSAVALDWSPTLTGARTININPSPEENDKWSDPVLYANASQLQVVVMSQPQTDTAAHALAHAHAERDQWEGLVHQFTPDTPDAVVAAAKRKISELNEKVGVS
jgi:hypothetical protein